MRYYLYKKSGRTAEDASQGEIEVHCFAPKPYRLALPGERLSIKTIAVRLNFWLISKGRARIFYVILGDKRIAHTSYLVPKCGKFGFLNSSDWEIGPCRTAREYRGQGIYPKVLSYITSSFGNDGTTFYMIVKENNLSSIKGIEKAGFKRCGTVKKTKLLKRYKRENKDE